MVDVMMHAYAVAVDLIPACRAVTCSRLALALGPGNSASPVPLIAFTQTFFAIAFTHFLEAATEVFWMNVLNVLIN